VKLLFSWECIGHTKLYGPDLRRRARLVRHEEDSGNRYNIYLCSVLECDYQSANGCEEMLNEIERVERGELETGVGSGNAWLTTFTRDGVQIDSHTVPDWDEKPAGHFSLGEFRTALEGWKRFFEMPAQLDTRLEVTLPDSGA
jgi:hypothetical protein